MNLMIVSIALGLAVAVVYSVWTAILVVRADFYSTGQKVAQVALTFLIPIVGAVIVHAVWRVQNTAPKLPDRDFIPQRTPDPDNAFAGGKWVDGAE